MGRDAPELPSLAAIKGLAQLRESTAQLQQATQLCNHAARAEMILRWLLDKPVKQKQLQQEPAFWSLFSQAVRLIVPERLAPLLSPVNIFRVAQDVLQANPSTKSDWLEPVAQCFELLFEVAAATGAGSLKSALSVDSQEAASFVNTWFLAVIRWLEDGMPDHSIQLILAPALQVWSHRKYHPEDSTVFAHTCLESAARLCSDLSSTAFQRETSSKRLSGGAVPLNARSSRDAVESMLARHLFIPARASFFRDHDGAGADNVLHRGPTMAGFELRSLEQLQTPKDQQDKIGLERYNRTVANLLDIVYRCTPLTTPRQRIRERPWIEAVFTALLSCCYKLQMEEDVVDALCRLLSNVRRPCLLSEEILIDMHNTRAKVAEVGNVEWRLIAHVAALQPTIYTEMDRAAQIFDSISLESEPNALTIIREQVLKPIIETFSETRALSIYIRLWHKQLCRRTAPVTCFFSPEVQEAFAAQVQSTLSSGQIVPVVQLLEESLERITNSYAGFDSPDDWKSHLFADMIILRGLFRGLVDDALLDTLTERVRKSFYVLSDFVEIMGEATHEITYKSTLWALLADLLRLWFPRWACDQDKDAILVEMASIQSSPAVQMATTLVNKGQSRAQYGNAEEHAYELVLIAVILTPRKDTNPKNDQPADLTEPDPAIIASMLICRPTLINTRQDLFSKALEQCLLQFRGPAGAEGHDELETQDLSSHQRLFNGLVSAGVSSHNDAVIELLVSTAENCLETNTDNQEGVTQVFLGLLILAELKPTHTNEEQRRRICSGLSKLALANSSKAETHQEIEQRQLSALMRWMPYTHLGPEVSSRQGDEIFWNVAGLQRHDGNRFHKTPSSSVEQLATIDLFDATLRSVLRHTLLSKFRSTKTDDRLSAFRKSSSPHIDRFCALDLADFDSRLAVAMRVLISEAGQTPGGSNTESKQHLLSTRKIRKYAEKLISILEGYLQQESRNEVVFCVVVDSLADLPRIEEHIETFAELCERLNRLISRLLSEVDMDVQAVSNGGSTIRTTTSARCFALACAWRLAPQVKTLPEVAASLISQRLTPPNSLLVLDSFRRATQAMLDANSKLALIDHILSSHQEAAVHALTLVREVLATIQKSDVELLEPRTPRQTVMKLLEFVVKPETSHQACAVIVLILREKPFLVDQYILEAIMAALVAATKLDSEHEQHFRDCCLILQLTLQQYRSRVQDRMHLLSKLVQDLFTSFKSGHLSVVPAAMLSRVLQLLCEPPVSRNNHKGGDLVDEARKTRANVGKYMQYVLHNYCVVALRGSISGDAREALKPGLWAIIAAMDTHNTDAIKTLSSSMNNSERAILRATYQEYEAVGKWSGR